MTMIEIKDLKTWAELESEESKERVRLHISKMKGRRRRARIRSNEKWSKDPTLRCNRCNAPRTPSQESPKKLCPFNNCYIILCYNCKTYIECAWGPIGCPCDKGGGHGTYDEMPRPSGKRK